MGEAGPDARRENDPADDWRTTIVDIEYAALTGQVRGYMPGYALTAEYIQYTTEWPGLLSRHGLAYVALAPSLAPAYILERLGPDEGWRYELTDDNQLRSWRREAGRWVRDDSGTDTFGERLTEFLQLLESRPYLFMGQPASRVERYLQGKDDKDKT